MRARKTSRGARAFLVVAALLTLLAPATALGWSPGTPLTIPFPRLGMWWPDTDAQSVQQLARYDWLLLGVWDDPSLVAQIKAQHPDEMVLNATNACEVDIAPNQPASSAENAEIRAVPNEWILTQCGATLTSAVDGSSGTLHVSAVSKTAPDGSSVSLFQTGDVLVIEGELAIVQSVNSSAKTLSVRRGVVKSAVSHGIGTRVAAAIEFWPDSLVMNLTTSCPRVTVDASAGPESWAEYNARIGAKRIETAAWDGLLIDRSDGDESWLIGVSTARSIDADRSNAIPASYEAFDDSWNAGLYAYVLRTRAAIGDSKLLMTNWGFPFYDLLNGNNFEGFPYADSSDRPWQETVLGPSANKGSYFEWMSQARQPNLSTVQTYQDDSGPSPSGDGSWDSPADDRGFVPDYRKMRYGLTTALLGDGFFSFEIGTAGHGGLGLLWFDEYDGAGRGRGWLGLPSAPAERVGDRMLGGDLLGGDGAFESSSQLGKWYFADQPGTAGTWTRDTSDAHGGSGSAHVAVTKANGVTWDVAASHPVSIKRGVPYTLSFWARAEATHTVETWVQQWHDPWDNQLYFGKVQVVPGWHQYSLGAIAEATESKAALLLAFGASTGDLHVDDVRLTSGDPNVWLRRFDNGVSVVNATAQPVEIDLGGLYRRLLGTQSPGANNGHLARHVTVPAHDGLVLAKTQLPADLAEKIAGIAPRYRALARSAYALERSYYKKSKHGSRSARKKARKARDAWRAVRLRCNSLASLASTAEGLARVGRSEVADALDQLDAGSARVVTLATQAHNVKRTTTGLRAVHAARSARSAVNAFLAASR